MIEESVARRYAKALFQTLAPNQTAQELEHTHRLLQQVGQAFKEHEPFRHVMLNPGFDREAKIRVLKALLEKIQAGAVVVRFMEYLVRKNRFRYLEVISRTFAVLVEESQGILTVPVTTAKAMSSEDQETVRRGVESATGRRVKVRWSVDPELIGGIVIQVGEAVVDGSIRGQLQAIRRTLISPA